MVEDELNQRDMEFEAQYSEEPTINITASKSSIHAPSQVQNNKKNTKSNKALKNPAQGAMSPKNKEIMLSYDAQQMVRMNKEIA